MVTTATNSSPSTKLEIHLDCYSHVFPGTWMITWCNIGSRQRKTFVLLTAMLALQPVSNADVRCLRRFICPHAPSDREIEPSRDRHVPGQVGTPIRLSTAKGIFAVEKGFCFRIPELGVSDVTIVTQIAPQGTGVLSLGRGIRINRCNAVWDERLYLQDSRWHRLSCLSRT